MKIVARAKASVNCVGCGRRLVNRQRLYCSRPCRTRAYHNPVKAKLRYDTWVAANPERNRARIHAWRLAHPGKGVEYNRRFRHAKTPCPFCDEMQKNPWAKSCRQCSITYGCSCTSAACGVGTRGHKHCPCGEPIERRGTHYLIEPCLCCQQEMARFGLSLRELFLSGRVVEEAA